MNTPRPKPLVARAEARQAEAAGAVAIRSASFVSIAVDSTVVRERGLPVADYFLWNDDFEYSTRLLRGRVGLWCPDSVVVHKTRTFGSTDADPGDRFFYEVRNKVWLFTRSRSLSPVEKAVYAASTVRRWARTVCRSSDRSTLRRAAWRGLRAGVRAAPAPTAEVLAAARAATDA
jgi:GT2 family glycosyltransferase